MLIIDLSVSVLLIFSKFLEKVVYISRTTGVIESLQQSERDSRVALQTPTNAFSADTAHRLLTVIINTSSQDTLSRMKRLQ